MRTVRIAAATAAALLGWAALAGQEVAAQSQPEGSPTGTAAPGKSPETPAPQGQFLDAGQGQGGTLVGGRSGAGPSSIQPGASPTTAGAAGGTGVGTVTPGSSAVAPPGSDAGAKK
jgi:hypothetical protein